MQLDNPDSEALFSAPMVWVEAPGGPRAYPILRARAARAHLLLTLKGISDRDQAEALKGKEIYLPEDLLPPLEEGEVYLYQLEGLRVETVEGEVLGRVEGTFETGANAVLVVVGAKGEYLLPFIEDVVQEIDLEGGVIRVELLEGLEPS